MRRKDREMDREFALAVTDKCEYATLAMAAKEGEPYCVPVTIARDGEKIYFHCAKVGTKVDMMRENPRVCMTCVGDTRRVPEEFTTKFESAVIRGRGQRGHPDDETKIHALRLICQRPCRRGNGRLRRRHQKKPRQNGHLADRYRGYHWQMQEVD